MPVPPGGREARRGAGRPRGRGRSTARRPRRRMPREIRRVRTPRDAAPPAAREGRPRVAREESPPRPYSTLAGTQWSSALPRVTRPRPRRRPRGGGSRRPRRRRRSLTPSRRGTAAIASLPGAVPNPPPRTTGPTTCRPSRVRTRSPPPGPPTSPGAGAETRTAAEGRASSAAKGTTGRTTPGPTSSAVPTRPPCPTSAVSSWRTRRGRWTGSEDGGSARGFRPSTLPRRRLRGRRRRLDRRRRSGARRPGRMLWTRGEWSPRTGSGAASPWPWARDRRVPRSELVSWPT